MMGVRKGASIWLVIIFVSIFHGIEGQDKFFTDFLKSFTIENPVFISSDEFDQDFSHSYKNASALIKYTTNKDEEQVADHLQRLHNLSEMTTVVFIDNGHQKLLDLMINDLQLFKKGLTGLVSEADVTTGINLTLRLDTRLYTYMSNGSGISLKEIYAINGINKVQIVGRWEVNTGLTVATKSMWERRTDLEGMVIRAATISTPQLHELHYDKTGESIIGASGLFLEPLNILAKELNFTLKWMPSYDGNWGAMDSNGTWNGLIDMLINEQIDIAAAGLFVTEERATVVTFGRAIAGGEWTIASASSTEPHANPWIYIEIFPHTIWYICCTMVISISTCFFIINYSGINNMHDKFESESFTIINSLGLSLTFLRQIYYDVNIKSNSSKLLFFLSVISTYLIFIHFTAYLTASSTYSKQGQIKSFRDVLDGGYQVSVLENSATHDNLRYAKPETAMNEVYHKTMKNRPDALKQSHQDILKILGKKKTLYYGSDFYLKSLSEELTFHDIQGFIYVNYYEKIFHFYMN